MAVVFACVGDATPVVAGNDGGPIADAQPNDAGPDTKNPADASASRITQIAAGWRHSCAIDDVGDLWCWGDNTYGQLGVPVASTTDDCAADNKDKRKCRAKPARVPGLADVRQVAAGAYATCAIVGTSGDTYCWGDNRFGELGHASGVGDQACLDTDGTTNACSVSPTKMANLADAVQVTVGATHACARNKSNAAFCWGDNRLGQIGNEVFGAAVPSPTAPSGLPPVVDIRAGFNSDTCAVSVSGGEVWCWGFSDWNQLGVFFGPNNNQSCFSGLGCVPKPARAQTNDGGTLTGQGRVYPGHTYTCSQAPSGGAVRCWGLRSLGLFADNDLSATTVPETIIPITAPIPAFETRWENSCSTGANGELSCWGQAVAGAVGTGSVGASDASFTPQKIASPTGVAELAGGYRYFLARDKAGAVWAYGANYAGNLGHAQGTGGDTPCPNASDSTSQCNGTPTKIAGLPGSP